MYFYFYLWDLLQSYKSALESRPFEISYKKKTRFFFALHGYQKNFVCDWEHLALTVLNSLKHLTLTIEAEKFHYGYHFFIYLSDAEGNQNAVCISTTSLKKRETWQKQNITESFHFGTNMVCMDQNRKLIQKLEHLLKTNWIGLIVLHFQSQTLWMQSIMCIVTLIYYSMSSTCYIVHDLVFSSHILQLYQSGLDNSISL